MIRPAILRHGLPIAALALLATLAAAAPDDPKDAGAGWIDLTNLESWRSPTGAWQVVGDVGLDPKDPKRLASEPGTGILVNGKTGRTNNLISKQTFRDLEFHAEFLIPKRSNSGVKFEGLYEVQIFDSFGVAKPKASDSGGIYPRAELGPPYHYVDDGHPPAANASKPAGEWQTLDVTFRAPRFDARGQKVASARFVRVVLNGREIHRDVPAATPTGHAWHNKEVPEGPLLLQADHGPIAFRNVRVRPLGNESGR